MRICECRPVWIATAALALIAAGCGGGGPGNRTPSETPLSIAGAEDQLLTGIVAGADPEGRPLTFYVTKPAAHGMVAMDASTGSFRYTPVTDYNGSDSFAFAVSDGKRRSAPAAVSIGVEPVNDAPMLAPPARVTNSVEMFETSMELGASDVDGDELTIDATHSVPPVADISVDASRGILRVAPHQRGETVVDVMVSDGALSVTASFVFPVTDVTKRRD